MCADINRLEVGEIEWVTGRQPMPNLVRSTGDFHRPTAIVTVFDRHGQFGQGEVSPLPGYSPHDIDDAVDCLEAFLSEGRQHRLRFALQAPIVPQLDAALGLFPMTPSVRFALESALFDLIGKRVGQPVHQLLNPTHHTDELRTHALLPSAACGVVLDEAQQRHEEGFTAFKVKLGRRGLREELLAIESLRRHFPDAEVRCDANGAWSIRRAGEVLDQLAHLGVAYVEQPVAGDALFSLDDPPLPIAADESLFAPGAFARLLTRKNCKIAVLKPAALGGLLVTLHMAHEAQNAGLDVVITHMLDGPLGMAAATELAFALQHAPHACGLASHSSLLAWDASVPQVDGPRLVRRDHAGLGLDRVALPS